MYNVKEGKLPSHLAVPKKVLINAYEDLSAGDYPATGRLCDDISSLGHSQQIVIDSLFSRSRTHLEKRLAGRVCESCVSWAECSEFAAADVPVDVNDRFSIDDNDGVSPDHKIIGSFLAINRLNK